jgi:hypothetical protein
MHWEFLYDIILAQDENPLVFCTFPFLYLAEWLVAPHYEKIDLASCSDLAHSPE